MAPKKQTHKKNPAKQTDPGFRRRPDALRDRDYGGQVAGGPVRFADSARRAFSKASFLIKNGVIISDPSLVFIDASVRAEKIAPGTVLHPFCRISGSKTSIGPGCILGAEAPVTLDDCQLGSEVKLGGGYFCGATFLDKSGMGSGAHVRPGTLLEEFASGAHTVGLKQTILFPYVALGSLINFCDCLMAGGTGRKNHGEVGSSYIHFNFTPHQDKATASLIGDAPRGVLLDQPPVFLGGQGGLVGPSRIAFGAIIPAGMIIRKDILSPGGGPAAPRADISTVSLPVFGQGSVATERDGHPITHTGPGGGEEQKNAAGGGFIAGAYRSIDRIVKNNLIYIGNICALKMWYRHARKIFMAADPFQAACQAGALERLDVILKERIVRLGELAEKMPRSVELNVKAGNAGLEYLQQQKCFAGQWAKMREKTDRLGKFEGDTAKRDACLAELSSIGGRKPYLEAMVSLSPNNKANASEWLQSIVDRAAEIWKTDKQEKSASHRGHRVHGDKN